MNMKRDNAVSWYEKLRVTKKMGKKAVIQLCWAQLAVKIISHLPKKQKGKPSIIFFAHTTVILEYAIIYWRILESDNNLKWEAKVAIPTSNKEIQKKIQEICRKEGIKTIRLWKVPWCRWDACVVTDHCFPDTLIDRSVPIVFYYHGLSSAKLIDGKSHKYAKTYTHDRYGRLKYSVFLEACDSQIEQAKRHNLALAPVLKAVGDPRIEQVMSLTCQREQIRRTLGVQNGKPVILIQTTWGNHSLDINESFLESLIDLAEDQECICIYSTHPAHWPSGSSVDRSQKYLALQKHGIRVLKPDEDRLQWIAIADACISDITSMSILFALTSRPLAFAGSGCNHLVEDSELANLIGSCPKWESSLDLKEWVKSLLDQPIDDRYKKIIQNLTQFNGQSRTRIIKIMTDLVSGK